MNFIDLSLEAKYNFNKKITAVYIEEAIIGGGVSNFISRPGGRDRTQQLD